MNLQEYINKKIPSEEQDKIDEELAKDPEYQLDRLILKWRLDFSLPPKKAKKIIRKVMKTF